MLAALRRAGTPYALTPGQLSRAMLVTTGAVTKRVDRLEGRGLVHRAVADGDARGRLITLTPDGVRLVDRLIEQHFANERALLAGLSERERAQLGGLLARLTVSVGEGTGAAGG
ncbi:MarR family transcriptional regulator [Streptomyces armeniacus]|uniref:MarR family transcriptional regulator n=2 Tax=Streptomyces armeniacus TaxID=83291 RepID=A0A345XZQ5_9ACTN|nr:MarR family transcriptional regulator [Streptomyces armeniacus]